MKKHIVGRAVAAALFAAAVSQAISAKADDAVAIDLTLKDHGFSPKESTAPAGKPLEITVTNMDAAPAEVESKQLKFEKIVPAGGKISVTVRPLEPGRYKFYDDYHEDSTVGFVVVQ